VWTVGLVCLPVTAAAQRALPAPGASYSAALVSHSGATLAVLGGVAGAGADVATASTAALDEVTARLEAVGLDRGQILRVRAALTRGADFAAWNEAWTDFFDGSTPPARTTVYSSGLPDDATVVLDVVAVYPTEAGHPVRVSGARETLNPNLRLAGPADNPQVGALPVVWRASGSRPRQPHVARSAHSVVDEQPGPDARRTRPALA